MSKGAPDVTIAQYATRLATAAALYALAGRVGLAIPFTANNVSPIWPASGVALACLLLFGWQCWPAIAVAAFVVNYFSPLPTLAALGLAVGNTSASLAGMFLLRRIPGFHIPLSRLRDVLALVALPAALASILSASIGSSVFALVGIKPWGSPGPTWLMYYLGDATGVLSTAPLLLSLGDWAHLRPTRRIVEFSGLLLLLAATCLLVFDERLHVAASHTVLALVVFPFVLWAAIRFGISGTAVTSIMIASVAVIETVQGFGPFSKSGPLTNALLLQFFFATVAVSGLLLAAVMAERHNAEAEREQLIREQAAQEAAHESEKRYRLIVEMANEGIWTIDSGHLTTFVNRRFAQMLAYEPEEMLGKSANEFCPAFPRPSQTCHAGEYRLRRKDSSDFWGALSAALIPDGQHGGYGMLVMVTDISERKRAEEHVLRSRMELQAVLDNSPALIYMKDENGRYTFVNRCWTDSFHASIEDVQGKTDLEIFPEASARQFAANDQEVAKRGKALEFEEQTVCEGRLRTYHSVKVALRDSAGRLSFCGISTDITERKRAEEELRENQQRLVSIYNTVGDVIFQLAVEPEGQFRFVSVNAAFLRVTGLSLETVVGKTVNEVIPEPSLTMVLRKYRQAVEEKAIVSWEETSDYPTGQLTGEASVAPVFDIKGNCINLVGSVHDITERKRAEEALQNAYEAMERRVQERTADLSAANERLLELDRLKSQFLASMSHELRTPLNSIVGFTSLLSRGLTGPVTAEQKKQLEIVQSSARHLLTLINDLLDLSRIEAGRADLERKAFDFANVLDEVVQSLTPMAGRKGLDLMIDTSTPEIPMLGDKKRTLQILLNLVNNAIKFTEKGYVKITTNVEPGMLRVTVTDTGIGIKAEHIGMLFEAFRQVDGSAKRIYEGTGLGLYLCKKLLGLMGGDIRVESVYGAGTCFTYVMPLELAVEAV